MSKRGLFSNTFVQWPSFINSNYLDYQIVNKEHFSSYFQVWKIISVQDVTAAMSRTLSSYSPVFIRYDFVEEMSIYGLFILTSSSLFFNYFFKFQVTHFLILFFPLKTQVIVGKMFISQLVIHLKLHSDQI